MKRLTWKRIKNILFGFTGTAIHCPYCKSLHVRTLGKSTIVERNGRWDEAYDMVCKDCNAKASMIEIWEKGNG